jgi:hypothetical protein
VLPSWKLINLLHNRAEAGKINQIITESNTDDDDDDDGGGGGGGGGGDDDDDTENYFT